MEPDDDLHNPELVPEKTDVTKKKKVAVTTRAITNVGCLVILLSALIVLLWVHLCIFLVRTHYLTNAASVTPSLHTTANGLLWAMNLEE